MINKPLIIFDWEVFPNWNCMVWNEYNEDRSKIQLHTITSDDDNYISEIKRVSKLGYLTGFNIKAYDMQILNFACLGYTLQELYEHSMSIINSKDGKWKDFTFWRKYNFIDLFDDIKMGSLKQFESNIGIQIKECDVPFGKSDLTEDEKKSIIYYCKQDVLATNILAAHRWGYLMAKANCSKISDLSEAECLKNTSAKLCAKMLGAKQRPNFNPPFYTIPEKLKPLFEKILHPNIIEAFEGQPLENDFSYVIRYFKNTINFGAGGVHSTYKDSAKFISNNDEVLVNADFENLYPSLLILFDYFSTGIPEAGKEQFKFILKKCRELKQVLRGMKKKGLKDTDEYKELFNERDSMKLVLNAATGAMRAKFSPLYDPQNIIALCFTGQLLTVCLAKIMHNLGALIIQTNTDGILFKISRSKLKDVYSEILNFEQHVGIPLEVEEQYAVFQKDVNNYILLPSKDAEPKLKGRWAKQSGSDVPLTPLFAPVINQSIIDYYRKGIPIEVTIRNCNCPLDFMMTTMKGPTYDGVVYETMAGDSLIGNINRVYAIDDDNCGSLYKIKYDDDGNVIKRDKIASIPERSCNYLDEVPKEGKLYRLDYDWYIKLAKKNLIEMEEI